MGPTGLCLFGNRIIGSISNSSLHSVLIQEIVEHHIMMNYPYRVIPILGIC